jgi:flagellar hook-associated protein 2
MRRISFSPRLRRCCVVMAFCGCVFGPVPALSGSFTVLQTFEDAAQQGTLPWAILQANSIKTDDDLISRIEKTVEAFNEIQASITDFTGFDPETGDSGILHGERTVIRVQDELGRLLTGVFRGAGQLSVVNQVGLRLGGDGKLSFDADKLRTAIAQDPEAVKQFFTAEEFGFADRLEKVTHGLATDDNALLISRLDSLTSNIRQNNERIEFLNDRLERTRERLINQFVKMEESIAKIQANLTAITSIQALPPLQ